MTAQAIAGFGTKTLILLLRIVRGFVGVYMASTLIGAFSNAVTIMGAGANSKFLVVLGVQLAATLCGIAAYCLLRALINWLHRRESKDATLIGGFWKL